VENPNNIPILSKDKKFEKRHCLIVKQITTFAALSQSPRTCPLPGVPYNFPNKILYNKQKSAPLHVGVGKSPEKPNTGMVHHNCEIHFFH
jgi:hypothetical protein